MRLPEGEDTSSQLCGIREHGFTREQGSYMPKKRTWRTRWIAVALAASAVFGVFMTFAVAFACELWMPGYRDYMAYRIAAGTMFGGEEVPSAVSAEEWRAGHWVMSDVNGRYQRVNVDPNPNPKRRFERLEAAASKDWIARFQKIGLLGRSETLSTAIGVGIRSERLSMEYWADDAGHATTELSSAGWPFYCLEGSRFQYMPGWQVPPPEMVRNLINLPVWLPKWLQLKSQQRFPIGIRWDGVIYDSAFWGAIIPAIVYASRILRRVVRIRRGRCVACGYNRRGLAAGAACPECGDLPRVSAAV